MNMGMGTQDTAFVAGNLSDTGGTSDIGSTSDRALLARMGAGDADAAAAFVHRFERRVYGLAVSIVFDRWAAEDVAQEAFVRAWRHAARFDPGRGSVLTWLLRITRNLAIDELRRRHAQPSEPAVMAAIVPPTPVEGVEDAAVTGAEASELLTALGILPAEQRRAVLAFAYGGLSAQEIARREGAPLGTIKSRIRRGLRTAREQGHRLALCSAC